MTRRFAGTYTQNLSRSCVDVIPNPVFVLYDLRHTCLTRWAKVMDTFTLKKLAGHEDLNTTLRYVHLNDEDVRAAMRKVAQIEHSPKNARSGGTPKAAANA